MSNDWQAVEQSSYRNVIKLLSSKGSYQANLNTRILCMCVCLFVTSEFSGTGRRSAAPLSPSWRASPGELL